MYHKQILKNKSINGYEINLDDNGLNPLNITLDKIGNLNLIN